MPCEPHRCWSFVARTVWLFLFATLAACTAVPTAPSESTVDFSPTQLSPNKHFLITLLPPATIPVQEIHSWKIKVATPDGKPVTKALVYMNGGMPEHGHGMPTRPAVTAEISEGTYLVEGVKFSMPGRWEILVAVQSGAASDITVFNQLISLPTPTPVRDR